MAVALPKDDWTPAKLKEQRAWRDKMYRPSVNKVAVRHMAAAIVPPKPVEPLKPVLVTVNFGYPILPLNDYKVFKFKLVQRAVAKAAGISVNQLISKAKQMPGLKARMIAIMLCRRFGGPQVSMSMIGKYFGGRDHTTILHALRKLQPVSDALDRRVSSDTPLPQIVAAAFDAWDELIQPRYDEIWSQANQRAKSLSKNGTRWAKK